MKYLSGTIFLLLIILVSCSPATDSKWEDHTKVKVNTTEGEITLVLYNKTPKHRDNFMKLAKEGVYDSLLFHRVIENFMIQGGDPDSKNASPGDTLGMGGLDYRVDAEFDTSLFHKKGVLAAAREGNPERASSSCQFYIVQGKVHSDSTLDIAQQRINNWLAQHYLRKDTMYKTLFDSLDLAMSTRNIDLYTRVNDSINTISESYSGFTKYVIPDHHRGIYKEIGGTPHLDQNYTVFGEVISGLNVVDSIAAEETNSLDRPVKDVRILSVEVINVD